MVCEICGMEEIKAYHCKACGTILCFECIEVHDKCPECEQNGHIVEEQ